MTESWTGASNKCSSQRDGGLTDFTPLFPPSPLTTTLKHVSESAKRLAFWALEYAYLHLGAHVSVSADYGHWLFLKSRTIGELSVSFPGPAHLIPHLDNRKQGLENEVTCMSVCLQWLVDVPSPGWPLCIVCMASICRRKGSTRKHWKCLRGHQSIVLKTKRSSQGSM